MTKVIQLARCHTRPDAATVMVNHVAPSALARVVVLEVGAGAEDEAVEDARVGLVQQG